MNLKDFRESFEKVEDFRESHKVKHNLLEIIFVAIVATVANSNTWLEIEAFGEIKESLLKRYVKLENGIPSHDTFQRVFEHLDPKAFNRAFMDWTKKLCDNTEGRIIALDGKTLRGSTDGNKKAIHIVNAWVDENNFILGQIKTDSKSNEITAIPELLDLLFLENSIVTIDAMGTQKDIAERIIKKKADYVLALKGNQGLFHEEVKEYMDYALENKIDKINISKKTTVEKGHGRIEKREYFQTDDIGWFHEKDKWKGLKSIGMVRRTVEKNGKITVENCYYISSLESPLEGECDLFAKAVRNHWGIESCHWMLDVVFKEDQSTVRKNNGAENLSMLRKIAMNILKNDTSGPKKISKNMKRFRASMDDSLLEEIINNI
ncbi:ISAs1 family transposase [Schnuerera sp.]|uniref:ISAs1 family transposase n=1 Tax=Schnuerera sp. TaxID=2794844 RepID=UPI002BD834D6|nr:ISAs1 family transposase [Schnuerera sp.]HSH35178.1 ISAs1 family transposase [Schnuerera sp.]